MRGDFGASEAQARKRAAYAMREGRVPSADAKPTDVHAAAEGAKSGPGGVAATLSEIERSKSAREAKCARRARRCRQARQKIVFPPVAGATQRGGVSPAPGARCSVRGAGLGRACPSSCSPGPARATHRRKWWLRRRRAGCAPLAARRSAGPRSLASTGRSPRLPRPHRPAQAQARAHAGVARAVEAGARGVRPPGLGARHRVRLLQRVVCHRRRRPHDQGTHAATPMSMPGSGLGKCAMRLTRPRRSGTWRRTASS